MCTFCYFLLHFCNAKAPRGTTLVQRCPHCQKRMKRLLPTSQNGSHFGVSFLLILCVGTTIEAHHEELEEYLDVSAILRKLFGIINELCGKSQI